jgi:hypothetical protein
MAKEMANLDNCEDQVDLEVHHVSVEKDQYFDQATVEQHMRVVFNDYHEHIAVMDNHSPSINATKEKAAPLIPKTLRKVLKAKSK